jgi:predicted PurR-regulated permease PerM
MTNTQLLMIVGIPIVFNFGIVATFFVIINSNVNNRINDLKDQMNQRFDDMNKRFDRLEEKIDKRIEALERRVS